ncbi:MAG: outer membrane lipoprotein-sorting protein [Chlamydiae bacterium]|nr:outer membrane lipoprotein-sorting protein [Chlamydiota bacterium]MBI3266814.1 outer membrane lipoprotein-sorting protein [Chlamydiota bacterium]
MKYLRLGLALVSLLCVSGMALESTPAAETPDGGGVMKEMIAAYYYARTDAKSEIRMRIVNRQGQTRERRLTLLRLDKTDGGEQSYYIYFREPADVQGMSFLVLKHPGGGDDRWLYLPAMDLVKRIATSDKRTSFAGSDFTYEDVSGRDLDQDEHTLEGEETLGEYSAFIVKSTPKHPGEAEFNYRKFWIDKATHLPLKVEHYDLKGTPYKVYETQEIQNMGGTPTVTKAVMKDLGNGRFTEITIKSVSYDSGITPDLFQERFLRRPPSQWIQ